MNFKYLYDQYTGLYSGIVRSPFPENSTEVEPYFHFACKTVWDFQKNEWKLVERFSFYEQFKDIDRVNELDVKTVNALKVLHESINMDISHLKVNINDHYETILKTYDNSDVILMRLADTDHRINGLKHDNDVLCHLQQTEMKFIKSQLHYLTTIIERPTLFQRLMKWLVFWR